jgi:hypothetical protein
MNTGSAARATIRYLDRHADPFFSKQAAVPIFCLDSVVAPVDQVDDDLDNGLFLFGTALRNQKCECHQGVVGEALGAVGAVEDSVVCEKVDEKPWS